MGKLRFLVIHCTATPESVEVDKGDVIAWHTNPRHLGGRGWNRPGYSDIIHLNGKLENIIPFDQDSYVDSWEISNGAKGINGISRHIVYTGGMDKDNKKAKDTRTEAQKVALETYVKYMVLRHPDIQVLGHNQAPGAIKDCPSFDVPKWLKSIGIGEKNIYC